MFITLGVDTRKKDSSHRKWSLTKDEALANTGAVWPWRLVRANPDRADKPDWLEELSATKIHGRSHRPRSR